MTCETSEYLGRVTWGVPSARGRMAWAVGSGRRASVVAAATVPAADGAVGTEGGMVGVARPHRVKSAEAKALCPR